jgi:hypothetical protein
LSKNKEIVGLFPVKKLDSDFLHRATMKVLELLHDCGYEVVSITSDNNKVNVKLFKNLCDGNIASHISNPFNPDKNIYLLSDTVHLAKNIPNNWLNEKTK